MLRGHTIHAGCLTAVQSAQEAGDFLWRHGAGTNHSTSLQNTCLDSVSNDSLLIAELFPTVTVHRLEVFLKVSGAAPRGVRKPAAPSQLDTTPEGGQIPITAQNTDQSCFLFDVGNS